jgi:glycosyltransferase involved in cell wall biosynthesis
MNIAFDIQPLVAGERTGVGSSEAASVRVLVAQHPRDRFFLEYFAFRKRAAKRAAAAEYLGENARLSVCTVCPGGIYRFIAALLPVPYRWFIRTRAEVTHFFNFFIPPFVRGKAVVTIHDMVLKRFPQTMRARTKYLLKWSMRGTLRRASRVVTDSEFSKREIMAYYRYPANRIQVVYLGVDTGKCTQEIDRGARAKVCQKYGIPGEYLLYLGMLEPRKNLERLIRAYARVQSRTAGVPHLVLAGGKGWRFAGIFRTVRELGLEHRVFFPGYIAEEDKPALLAGASVFCFPSLYEGFGLPVLEAMACGVPVLTANGSALPEVAGEAALLVDPFSVEEIARGMERLCFDEPLRTALRAKGLERVKRFTWERTAAALYALYQEVADEQNPGITGQQAVRAMRGRH